MRDDTRLMRPPRLLGVVVSDLEYELGDYVVLGDALAIKVLPQGPCELFPTLTLLLTSLHGRRVQPNAGWL